MVASIPNVILTSHPMKILLKRFSNVHYKKLRTKFCYILLFFENKYCYVIKYMQKSVMLQSLLCNLYKRTFYGI